MASPKQQISKIKFGSRILRPGQEATVLALAAGARSQALPEAVLKLGDVIRVVASGELGFFENGGSQLWAVRTVHHTDITDPGSATAVRGFGYLVSPGAPTPAVITGAIPGPFQLADGDVAVLADGQTLTLRFDGGKALVLGGVLTLASDTEGTGSSVEVKAVVEAGSDSGSANSVRIEGKDPGSYANRVETEVRAATSGDAAEFDLAVIEDGVYRETFPNLSMEPTAERYIERIVNDARLGSVLVRVIDGSRTLKGDSNFPYVAERRVT